MSSWYVDRVHEAATRVCQGCGRPLAWVDEVGWVDTDGDSYDMCRVDRFANHLPGDHLPAPS